MFDYDKRFSNAKICELFIEHGKLASDGHEFFCRTGQVIRRIPANELNFTLRSLMSPETRMEMNTYQLNMLIEMLKQDPEIRIETDVFNTGKIVFRNGIYSVSDGQLHPFDGKYSWAIVDADYIEDSDICNAPVFKRFLESSLDYHEKPDKTKLLLQVIGYLLSDYVVAKKAFFFIGEPSSGKSKFLEFLQKLLGDEDVSQIPFSQLSSRFSQGLLRGKRLNVCTELPSDKFPSIEAFKALTAGDRVYGELKGKDGFDFYPRARIICAGNSVPVPRHVDGTVSITDRMTFLFFGHSIPREEWNLDLVNDLLEERNIICSLAVKALREIAMQNFEFMLPDDSKAFVVSYKDSLNPVDAFFREVCEIQADATVSSQQLWDSFTEFCSNNNLSKGVSRQVFAQKVEAKNEVQKKRVWVGGKKQTIFSGIRICDSNNAKKVGGMGEDEKSEPRSEADSETKSEPESEMELESISESELESGYEVLPEYESVAKYNPKIGDAPTKHQKIVIMLPKSFKSIGGKSDETGSKGHNPNRRTDV